MHMGRDVTDFKKKDVWYCTKHDCASNIKPA